MQGRTLEEWARQLKDEEEINWLYRPFSRCLKCNCLLEKTEPTLDVPPLIRESVSDFWFCANCSQMFWQGSHTDRMRERLKEWQKDVVLTIGLGGDLMIGRSVNAYLDRHPSFSIWGNLHSVLSKTDFNIVNLETALTRSDKILPKVYHFKADPEKVSQLLKGPIHAVNLANNHILDFSKEGLIETIQTLDLAKIPHVGAGSNLIHAKSSVILEKNGIKIGLLGCTDNEPSWLATEKKPGTFFVSIDDLTSLRESIESLRRKVDFIILSIHWGPNMRKRPLDAQRAFAHELVNLGVDIIHGHSAHIFQGIEIYKKKAIFYDTGDLVDDYAIDPILRNDRSFFFIVEIDRKGLRKIRLIPTCISDFQVNIVKGKEREEMFFEMQNLSKEFQTILQVQNEELVLN